jgi:hypothetical protein
MSQNLALSILIKDEVLAKMTEVVFFMPLMLITLSTIIDMLGLCCVLEV